MSELTNYEEAQKKYRQSERGRKTQKRYAQSEKGKAARLRYLNSVKSKASQLKYQLSQKGKKTYSTRLSMRSLLSKCEKYLKKNPEKTIEDFLGDNK